MGKVYFTREINSDSLIKMYECLNEPLKGNIAVKISTGELGGHNYLKPALIKDLVSKLNGTIVECNTAYKGKRNTTCEHLEVIKKHGFLDIANVDIMDSEGEISLPIENGKHLKENIVGSHLKNYNSMLVLSHFKGHQMGGFGGALKNMSIGVASSSGKANIHTSGKTKEVDKLWDNLPNQDDFLESMVEADKTVIDYMDNIVYINVMNNLSIDCDCSSNPASPCMKDIGILSSKDPVSLDKACLDLIYNSSDQGKFSFIERVEKQHGAYILEYAEELNIGTKEYELIDIDNLS